VVVVALAAVSAERFVCRVLADNYHCALTAGGTKRN